MKNKINIKGIEPNERLFHNEKLNIYQTSIDFESIDFWPKNHRTVLHFDLLEAQEKKPVEKLLLHEITSFLVGRPELQLVKLADSIEKNGVKVPLIILSNGLLLDGNRRYFACSYLFYRAKRKSESIPKVLNDIPVSVIKEKDVNERIQRKILAEANFVEDHKVSWTLDVKAKVIRDFYESCIDNRLSHEEAYAEIQDVYSEKKNKVDSYLNTIKLTDEFISSAPSRQRDKFRELVQGKFLYFWEFRNKAFKGSTALDPKGELPKVKNLFFKMIETQRFKNFKQVEPMIRAVRDKYTWGMLSESKGSKIEMVEAIIKERKAIKSAEDKVRNFLKWLQDIADPSTFSKATFTLLRKLRAKCSVLLKKGKG